MEDCDVITEIPFVIKILLSFFKRGSESILYTVYLVSARKLRYVPESQLFYFLTPRLKKAQQNFMSCR